jgi:hypothetical protein
MTVGIPLSAAAHLPLQTIHQQKVLAKAAATNVQACEIHFGQVAGAPVQGRAVTGAGSGGAAAGTNKRKVPVYIDGNTVAQFCSYPADYYPITGDVVAILLSGTDKRARAHYDILFRFASGQSPSHDSNTVAEAVGVTLGTGATTVATFDPYAIFGVTSGFYRCSIALSVASTQTISVWATCPDSVSGFTGDYYFLTLDSGTVTELDAASLASGASYAGLAITCNWAASSSGSPIAIHGTSSGGTAKCSGIIECIG